MKYYITLLLIFSFSKLSYGNGDPVEVIGHLKKVTGETINLYEYVSVNEYNDVLFKNEKSKITTIKGKDVVWIETASTMYLSQPDEKKKKYSLKKLIAINEKYKMFMTSSKSDFVSNSVYIYDMNDNMIEKFYCSDGNLKFVKQKTETVDGIEKYFGDCKELISSLRKNVEGKKTYLFNGIYYTSCPGSPDRSVILK